MEIHVKHTVTLSQETVDFLMSIVSIDKTPAVAKSRKTESVPVPAVAPAKTEIAPPASSNGPEITIEQVRAAGIKKAQENGKRQLVTDLLGEFGVKKTTELKPEQFAAFIQKVEAL